MGATSTVSFPKTPIPSAVASPSLSVKDAATFNCAGAVFWSDMLDSLMSFLSLMRNVKQQNVLVPRA